MRASESLIYADVSRSWRLEKFPARLNRTLPEIYISLPTASNYWGLGQPKSVLLVLFMKSTQSCRLLPLMLRLISTQGQPLLHIDGGCHLVQKLTLRC